MVTEYYINKRTLLGPYIVNLYGHSILPLECLVHEFSDAMTRIKKFLMQLQKFFHKYLLISHKVI